MRLYGLLGGKYVSMCEACGKVGACSPGKFYFRPFIRRNLVESGSFRTNIYCVIKAFIFDLHVK